MPLNVLGALKNERFNAMSLTLFWLQAGGCGGDSMALLGIEWPNLLEFLQLTDIDLIWHPSLSNGSHVEYQAIVEELIAGDRPLDIFVLEGAVIRGPGGTGRYDTFANRPRKDMIAALARQAGYVIALGTCASFGGIGADGEVGATGLQFHKGNKGGFLGKTFCPAGVFRS